MQIGFSMDGIKNMDAKNFKTPKKKEEHRGKLVKHRRNGQGHRDFLETQGF